MSSTQQKQGPIRKDHGKTKARKSKPAGSQISPAAANNLVLASNQLTLRQRYQELLELHFGKADARPKPGQAFTVFEKDGKLVVQNPNTPRAPEGFVLMKKSGTGERVGSSVGRAADSVWDAIREIRDVLNVEEKYVDFTSAANFNYTGTLLDLTAGISQGPGVHERTGDSIKVTRIEINFTILAQGASTNWTWTLGYAKDAQPALSDVYNLSGATSAQGGLSFPNDAHSTVLREIERFHGFVAIVNTGNPGAQYHRISHKCNLHVNYALASTTVTEGDVFFCGISDIVATVPLIQYSIRMYFVDN